MSAAQKLPTYVFMYTAKTKRLRHLYTLRTPEVARVLVHMDRHVYLGV